MDGFFVAKFKVEKRTKKMTEEEDAEDDKPLRKLNEEGELVEEKQERSAFDEEADVAIIQGQFSNFCMPLNLEADLSRG